MRKATIVLTWNPDTKPPDKRFTKRSDTNFLRQVIKRLEFPEAKIEVIVEDLND